MKKTRERFSWFARKTLRTMTLLLAIGAAAHASAATKTNPVTGATESYVNVFTAANSSEWNAAGNWDTGSVPFVSGGNYNASLIDGKTATTSTQLDGWTLRIGAYNGATVNLGGGILKIQNDSAKIWLTADETSKITIASFSNNRQLENANAPFVLTSANAGGITWTAGITGASSQTLPFHYYLKGMGSVVYGGNLTISNPQVIKQADVTLTGTSQVSQPKTLVSFGSGTTATFTADAAIKVYGTDGTTLVETVNLATVNTTGSTTLTASDPVGSCEIVQTSTGIVLYYVDGDPDAIVAKTYTPSININFTAGTALSTAADVGLGDYAVPGTSWNNFTVANNATLSSLNKVDSTGAASATTASVTITNTRGYWYCSSLAAASDLRAGYIDETADVTTPTVTVSDIPYDQYKVIVYTATDAANVAFGYVTINGTNYTYADDALTEGTTAWGASGEQNTANALAEGVNVLVSPTITGSTLTVIGHRSGNNPRGCIAAVQIVKVEQQVGENDLLIELDGDKTYTFDEAKAYSGTVYVTGSGTLTFAGSASTAATLNIGPNASVNMVGSTLTPTTVTGYGTAIYDGTVPATGKGWTDSANWQGTLWVKNCSTFTKVIPNTVVNANSVLRLTDCSGWFNDNDNAQTCDGTLELVDGNTAAFTVSDGYSNNGMTTFAKLKGDGTLTHSKGTVYQRYVFTDPSEFTGTINIPAGTETYGSGNNRPLRVILGDYSQLESAPPQGSITIVSGATATVASGKTWTAAGGGIVVYGTLNINGTLAVSSDATSAIKGSGTVVFTGRAPTPTGDTWWKNSSWTGTVQIKSHGITAFDTNLYGNENSTLKFTSVTGYFAQNHVNIVPIELEDSGDTPAFEYNNGWGGELLTFSELKGTGTLKTSTAGNGGTIWVKKFSDFAGTLTLTHKKVILGGSEPTHPNTNWGGRLVVAEGETATIASGKTWGMNSSVTVDGTLAVNGFIWASGGIAVNGTFTAAGRGKWGGGTAVVINDTGVLELTSTGNVDESNSSDNNYGNVTGTGTIKFNGTGYRGFPYTSPADTLSIVAEQANGLVFRQDGKVIGSLSGTKNLRSDLGGSGKTLTIKQAKDGVWSGIFKGGEDRLATIVVAPGDSTTGTLTLAGTQDQSNWTDALTVSGSVNLTGTWKGDATVSGTFGGTGTLTGALTFSDGAKFKVFGADIDGLSVSGAVTAGSNVTIALADGVTINAETTILTATGSDITGTFALDSALADDYTLTQEARVVKIVPNDKNIYASDGVTVVGYMDGTTAIINDTSVAVTIPATATSAKVYPTGEQFIITGAAMLLSKNLTIKATIGSGSSAVEVDVTSAFSSGNFVVDGTSATMTMTLEPPTVPTVAAGVDGIAPVFTVTTVPGLWYGVVAGDSPDAMSVVSGTVSQAGAGETSKTFAAPAFSGTVQYYTVAVGVAESEFTE